MRSEFGLKVAICFGLVAITFAVFGQTLGHGFINYDDPAYVSENAEIHAGLNKNSLAWAFTHIHSHNWHPLTTMSHMLDWQLFGAKSGAHHLINLLFHSANAVLLFLLLAQMMPGAGRTGAIWTSAFVAAVFAIHPLHVESVAWISERKDVLSGFFFLLTLLAYLQYTRKRSVARYLTMSILFAFGLLSKPMLVTVPVILLLLDYWPLNRSQRSEVGGQTKTVISLIVEKIPLFILSITCAVVTLIVQNTGAIGLVRLDVLPFWWRITNALAACFIYIRQMFWPTDLALAYNHPDKLPGWEIAGLAAAFITLTAGAFILRKRFPYLLVGWGWYLIMLLPVVGLVQVGGQAHADRYTYLPQIGLYLAIVWAIVDLTQRWRSRAPVLGALAVIILSALTVRANGQVRYWRDSETLWRHTLAVTKDSDVAHTQLGMLFASQGRTSDAIREYEQAVSSGSNPDVETTVANLLLAEGRANEAMRYYQHVALLDPASALAHYNLAVCLHRLGLLGDAINHYKEALRLDPNYPDANEFLNQAVSELGQSGDPRFRSKKP